MSLQVKVFKTAYVVKYLLITRLVDTLSASIRFHLSITYLYLRRAMSTVNAIVLSRNRPRRMPYR